MTMKVTGTSIWDPATPASSSRNAKIDDTAAATIPRGANQDRNSFSRTLTFTPKEEAHIGAGPHHQEQRAQEGQAVPSQRLERCYFQPGGQQDKNARD